MSSPGSPGRKTRQDIVDALETGEFRYLKALRATVTVFLAPMKTDNIISDSEAAAIFRNLPEIRATHTRIQSLLQRAVEEDTLSATLSIMSSGLQNGSKVLNEVYLPFLKDRVRAIETLRECMKRSSCAAFVERAQSEDERVGGWRLEELLERPVERLREYRDAFAELAALSPEKDPCRSGCERVRDIFARLVSQGSAMSAGSVSTPTKPSSSSSSPAGPATSSPVLSDEGDRLRRAAEASFQSPTAPQRSSESDEPARSVPSVPTYTRGVSGGVSVSANALPRGRESELVAQARAETEELSRTRDVLVRDGAVAEEELRRARETPTTGTAAPDALSEAMSKLEAEEKDLYDRLAQSVHRDMFLGFLKRKKELEEEESRLSKALEEHEDALSELRAKLADPPASLLPSDPTKAELYRSWKRALADREELLRQARRRKHELMRDLRARHETQVVLLEEERRAAVDGLRESVEAEKRKAEEHRAELERLDAQIEQAREAMHKFREDFENLRVALLIDRMAKSSQVATLSERRKRLLEEAEAFKRSVDEARRRVAAEEAAKWDDRLREERERGRAMVEDERRRAEDKMQQIRKEMEDEFNRGFQPLLEQAEEQHRKEEERVRELEAELRDKEAELTRAKDAVRRLASGASDADADAEADVPEHKRREFEDLKREVATLWEELAVPEDDVVAFLAECDLMAPFSERVLEMYQDMHRRLTEGDPSLMGSPSRSTQQRPSQHRYPMDDAPEEKPSARTFHTTSSSSMTSDRVPGSSPLVTPSESRPEHPSEDDVYRSHYDAPKFTSPRDRGYATRPVSSERRTGSQQRAPPSNRTVFSRRRDGGAPPMTSMTPQEAIATLSGNYNDVGGLVASSRRASRMPPSLGGNGSRRAVRK